MSIRYPAMGMILLDVEFRAERAFKIRIPRNWPAEVVREGETDATLDQFHEYLLRLCREQSVIAPKDSWERVLKIIVDASCADESQLGRDTQLIRDIAPYG